MQKLFYDVIVVGGGIIGTATARELLIRNPKLKLAILEKEKCFAVHQSGRNSGVVHSGIYYAPGSLKSKLCIEGLDLAYKYFDEKQIPYKKCGKLIIAVNHEEKLRINDLFKRGLENGVKGLELLNSDQISKIEPNVKGLKAIWSPNTGIVDWAQVTKSYGEDCKEKGADIYFDFYVQKFNTITNENSENLIVYGKNIELRCKYAVTCGGLYSDTLAMMTGCSKDPKIIPFRGHYLLLKPEFSNLVKANIYPVPYPGLPFLGVHVTPRMDGSIWLGPNAVLALKKEGYKYWDFDKIDIMNFITYSGFRKLIRKYLFYGLGEMYKGLNINAQIYHLQHFLPDLKKSHVINGPTGVRAQAVDSAGKLIDDFLFDFGKNNFSRKIMHVRNAPSPAATSSLAIAKVIVDNMEKIFCLNM